jgi:myo-inositol-1(or 4)-monophosphatase
MTRVTEALETRWQQQLATARECARRAGEAIKPEFGRRHIIAYKGLYDVQLRADLVAHQEIVTCLAGEYPDYGIISEEAAHVRWVGNKHLWAVDPLDGTNNFGYGIAHFAVAITLFEGNSIALALVFDPILEREFLATSDHGFVGAPVSPVKLGRATVSLVTDYSPEERLRGRLLQDALGKVCKRVFTLWAPALDLALVADGMIDAMICRRASFLDVCAGMFLVRSGQGTILGPDGAEVEVGRALHNQPVSFVAARDAALAHRLFDLVCHRLDGD